MTLQELLDQAGLLIGASQGFKSNADHVGARG